MHIVEVFLVFFKLGLTSFGGPVAHISYFHNEFVNRKKWIDSHSYTDLVALCQFLPGPASSQVGIAIGYLRAGYMGSIAAWLGFTLPTAVILILLALGISHFSNIDISYLRGLKISAVAVVAHAIWSMSKNHCADIQRTTIAIIAAIFASVLNSVFTQISIIAIAGFIGIIFLRKKMDLPHVPQKSELSKKIAKIFLCSFFALLVLSPLATTYFESGYIKKFDSFYRAGSLVFGGGHVVLPLLKNEIVLQQNMVSNTEFMTGYGATQAMPGPLFAFSAYLGAISKSEPTGLIGGIICLVAIFLPSYLLILGVLPYWENWRKYANVKYAMQGINAAVVGLLISAFYNPVWTSAIFNIKDFILAFIGFLLLVIVKAPSWLIVVLSALASGLFLTL